jgi:hypothetical protein
MPDDTTWKTSYNIGNAPKTLGVIPAKSPEDYNSIGHSRVRTYPVSRWIRTQSDKDDQRPDLKK